MLEKEEEDKATEMTGDISDDCSANTDASDRNHKSGSSCLNILGPDCFHMMIMLINK